jgi:hypothetical protein
VLTPQSCATEKLKYSGECLFPEIALSVGVE